jgi:hypothetical protein
MTPVIGKSPNLDMEGRRIGRSYINSRAEIMGPIGGGSRVCRAQLWDGGPESGRFIALPVPVKENRAIIGVGLLSGDRGDL